MVREHELQIIATICYSRLQYYINLQNKIVMIVNIRKKYQLHLCCNTKIYSIVGIKISAIGRLLVRDDSIANEHNI